MFRLLFYLILICFLFFIGCTVVDFLSDRKWISHSPVASYVASLPERIKKAWQQEIKRINIKESEKLVLVSPSNSRSNSGVKKRKTAQEKKQKQRHSSKKRTTENAKSQSTHLVKDIKSKKEIVKDKRLLHLINQQVQAQGENRTQLENSLYQIATVPVGKALYQSLYSKGWPIIQLRYGKTKSKKSGGEYNSATNSITVRSTNDAVKQTLTIAHELRHAQQQAYDLKEESNPYVNFLMAKISEIDAKIFEWAIEDAANSNTVFANMYRRLEKDTLRRNQNLTEKQKMALVRSRFFQIMWFNQALSGLTEQERTEIKKWNKFYNTYYGLEFYFKNPFLKQVLDKRELFVQTQHFLSFMDIDLLPSDLYQKGIWHILQKKTDKKEIFILQDEQGRPFYKEVYDLNGNLLESGAN